jgi:pimeloyl-ACP methyl ester carboxylesterase
VSSRPHVLLLPGLACDADVWHDQARLLSLTTAVTVVDYAAADSIKKMAEIALAIPSGPVAIAGHSMGGRVAFEIMRMAPGRVAGLALLDTAYRGFPGGQAGEREIAKRSELLDLARTKGMRAMAEFWMPGIIHPDRISDTALTSAIVAMMSRKTPEIFAAQIKALLGRPDATALLSTIGCPTLVLCGRKDTWSPLEGHREIAAAIPHAHLAVIERCGHMAPMERPAEVTAALGSWLAGLTP